MRLIDADELTKRYQQMMEYEHNYNAAPISWVAAFEEFIDSIENAQTVDGWISAKDRMPDKNGQYLCWFGKNTIAKGAAIATYLEMWKSFGSLESLETYPNVTHWMPLPEPPKEESDGNRK